MCRGLVSTGQSGEMGGEGQGVRTVPLCVQAHVRAKMEGPSMEPFNIVDACIDR